MEMMRRCVTLLAFVVLVMGWNAGSSSIVGVSHRRAGGGEGGGSDSDGGGDGDVTYDGRSLIVGGQRRLFFSGSIHYPRSTPQMWPSLITKAKDGGIEVIQTYVFWNLHEPKPGQYDFSGRHDLVKFIKEVQKQGLYVCLRIGPYIESEWAYGGFPFWLHDIPDIVFRSDNQPFKFYMQNFTTKIVELMKSENLYASQGGPIILSQIENEYQNVESGFGDKGPSYVVWAANMAVGLQTGVPWVMCKQTDAPHPVINTCNGMKCGETFTGPNSPNKPSMWTENWTSFYEVYGKEPYLRSAEDIAFHVALFIAAKNGSYVNYYMFHGGTNFGRKASAYVLTSYYDQAPIDEYGLLRQPKWGHLKDLHTTIKNCSDTILEGTQSNFSLGPLQEAYLFEQEKGDGCVAFLINNNAKDFADVKFRNRSFQLQPKSISILPDCATIAFNTANVTTEPNERTVEPKVAFDSNNGWEKFTDTVPCFADTSLRADGLLEHMNTTKDESDYLWYTFRLETDSVTCSEPVVLHAVSYAHIAHAFINGQLAGGAHGNHDVKNFTLEVPISLGNAENNISILSVMAGLPDSGAFMERKFAGLSKVELRCSDDTTYDLSNSTWGYQVGLMGETLQIYQEKNSDKVAWSTIQQQLDDSRPLTWYKSKFDAPKGDDPVALNLTTMGKGEAWVNGESIGRYWVSFLTPRGQPSQSLYHIPRSFLQPSENVLVMVEEEAAGNPLGISLNVVSTAAAARS